MCFAFLFADLLYSREAGLSVSSSLQRDRVMEARFDDGIFRLSRGARAIDVVMFRREAWDVRSGLNTGASCSRYHIAKGTFRGGGLRLEMVPSPAPALRKGINRSQRRSLCFLFPPTVVGVPLCVKFGPNFTFLRREDRSALSSRFRAAGDSVRRRDLQRLFLRFSPGKTKTLRRLPFRGRQRRIDRGSTLICCSNTNSTQKHCKMVLYDPESRIDFQDSLNP